MKNELSPEDAQALKLAKAAQGPLNQLGVHEQQEVNQQPIQTPKVKDQPAQPPLPEMVRQAQPQTQPQTQPQSQDDTQFTQKVEVEEDIAFGTFLDVDLPSKNKFYSDGLKAQGLKVPDILLIQGMDENNVISRFTEIFTRRVRGVSPLDILAIDEYFLSLWMRASSFPEHGFTYGKYTCSNNKCKAKVPHDLSIFDFGDIKVETNIDILGPKYGDKGYVEIPLKTCTARIYPRRRIHDARTEKILNDEYYDKGEIPPKEYEKLVDILAPVEIDDIKDMRNVIKLVNSESFNTVDFVNLIEACNDYRLTEKIIVNMRCPNCKEVTPMSGYPFRTSIYFPDISSSRRSQG